MAPRRRYWDPALTDIFNEVNPATYYGYRPGEFTRTEEREGRELFYKGWVESPRVTGKYLTPEQREEWREKFKDWISEWDIDVPFPWDDWREWYEEQ